MLERLGAMCPRHGGRCWCTTALLAPRARWRSAIVVLVCPRCAWPRRIVGVVTEPHAVRRLLGALSPRSGPDGSTVAGFVERGGSRDDARPSVVLSPTGAPAGRFWRVRTWHDRDRAVTDLRRLPGPHCPRGLSD